jgi:hypothetical protein
MTVVGRLSLLAGVLAFGCGGARPLGGTSQVDATADVRSEPDTAADVRSAPDAIADVWSEPVDFDASDLPLIEVDCTPSIAEIGRFFPACQFNEVFFAGADAGTPHVSCERIADAGGWVGSIDVYFRRPQEIVIGQPMIVGGTDPAVSIAASSGSVIMNLVQTIPGSDAGAILIEAFEPGRRVRGRFVDATFSSYPRPPTLPCRISNAEFIAQAPAPG